MTLNTGINNPILKQSWIRGCPFYNLSAEDIWLSLTLQVARVITHMIKSLGSPGKVTRLVLRQILLSVGSCKPIASGRIKIKTLDFTYFPCFPLIIKIELEVRRHLNDSITPNFKVKCIFAIYFYVGELYFIWHDEIISENIL